MVSITIIVIRFHLAEPTLSAPPAKSPSKQPPPNAGKRKTSYLCWCSPKLIFPNAAVTSPKSQVATFSQPIPGGRTSADIAKPPSNPRASGVNQLNSTRVHVNKGEHKASQYQSVGQASSKRRWFCRSLSNKVHITANHKENKQTHIQKVQAHPQKVQGHTLTQQMSPISQASKQQSLNQERSPPPSRPREHNLTAKKTDEPSSTGIFSSLFGRTQVESASPAKVPKNPPHVSQNLNKRPPYPHPPQETSQKSNNGQRGATHMHQKDNRSARRSDTSSSVESMPRAMKSLPVHQTEVKAKNGQVSNMKAVTDCSPHVLGLKPAPSHSPAVNGGSSHRLSPMPTQDQKTSSKQNMTSGPPDAKRLPMHAQSTNAANSKHLDSHKATPVPNSINVKSSSHPQATKKESLNRNQGAMNATKSQATVAQTGSPGIMSKISYFFGWPTESKPSVTVQATDKRVPATKQPASNVKKVAIPTQGPSPDPSKSRNVQTPVSNLLGSKPLKLSTSEQLLSGKAKNVTPVVEKRYAQPLTANSTGRIGWSQWATQLLTNKDGKGTFPTDAYSCS
ncbi:hypothetical protein AX17_003235 [Amanita inopinata Kibby_2008]|nr:hypothetical protein AX17_003235 [Amanita inopinata Kibby_2008]